MAYHKDRGDQHRNICLIPDSAHGTNAASAQMAGLVVVTLPTDKYGGVPLEVFREKVRGLHLLVDLEVVQSHLNPPRKRLCINTSVLRTF